MGAGTGKVDAIVIGSGFGGAVSAARLAGAGLRVLVLERGPWWVGGGKDTVWARAYPRGVWGMRKALRGVHWARGRKGRSIVLRRDGLLELHVFDAMTALTGSGIGGGSLIYGDVQAQPDDAFFDFFPPEITAHEMRPYYARVRDTMRPSPFPVLPTRSAVLDQVARAHGLQARPAELAVFWPQEQSAGEDHVATSYLLGCEYEGKRSLDKTYIPLAMRNGAEVRALCEVVALSRAGRNYRVRWIDHHAGHRRGEAEAAFVVVAAGTLGTLRLLFAARDADRTLNISPALGRHFSTGGDVAASLFDCPEAEDSVYGPSPASGVAFAKNGRHLFFIVESGLPLYSLPLPGGMRRSLRHNVGLAGMGREASTGVVRFDGREIHTAAGRAMDPGFFEELETALGMIAEAYHPKKMSFERGARARLTTVHPMGGASIGTGPVDGVVDHAGQVFGNPGLYVADASVFPHAPGWPPSMTIAALAERQSELMIGARH